MIVLKKFKDLISWMTNNPKKNNKYTSLKNLYVYGNQLGENTWRDDAWHSVGYMCTAETNWMAYVIPNLE